MSSKIRILSTCQHCGGEFIAKTTVTKYCGDRCAKAAYKARKRAEKIAQVKPPKPQVHPTQDPGSKAFLSIKETCQLTGLSRTTLWRLIKQDKLKVWRAGSRVVIQRETLNALFH